MNIIGKKNNYLYSFRRRQYEEMLRQQEQQRLREEEDRRREEEDRRQVYCKNEISIFNINMICYIASNKLQSSFSKMTRENL
jgi:hypothetical protein